MSECAFSEQPWSGRCCNCRCEVRLTQGDLDNSFFDDEDGVFLKIYFVCKACNDRIGTNGWKWAFTYYQRFFGATRRRAVLYVYSHCVPDPASLGGAEAIVVRRPDPSDDGEDVVDPRCRRFRRSFLDPPPWMSGEYAAPLSEDVPGPSGSGLGAFG